MAEVGVNSLLGNLFVYHGVISQSQLDEALHRQESSGEPLGQILLAMGAATEQEVEMMLRAQSRLRGRAIRNRPHIMIVDDDPEVGAVVSDILAGAGYSVGVAQNAQEALAALSSEDRIMPTLVVLDLTMPGLSGLELLPELRKLTLPTTSYVVLTGNPTDEAEVEAKQLGVREFMTKPAPARQLVSVIDAVLQGSPPPSR